MNEHFNHAKNMTTAAALSANAKAEPATLEEAVQNQRAYRALCNDLVHALEECIKEGWDWSSEQEADAVLRRAKRMMGI